MTLEKEVQAYQLQENYTGARATPALVGREEVLQQIQPLLFEQTASAIVYITGAGGVGKTRLLDHILRQCAGGNLLTATRLIDLYHTRNRSVGGLIESILDVVEPVGKFIRSRPPETEVDEKLEALARAEQEGLSASDLVSRRQELTDLLLATINQFTVKQRLILAFDTAERLYIAKDIAQEKLGLSEQRPAVLDWLLNALLPKLQNVVLLVAGRPQPLNLAADLERTARSSAKQLLMIDLLGLREKEVLQYFTAVVAQARRSGQSGDAKAAAIITQLKRTQKQAIFHCLHDGGPEPRIRPILLALALDHLIIAGQPLPELTEPLRKAKELTDAQRRAIEQKLGLALVRILHENRRPADAIILMLGWLRKGADVKLLSKLTELPEAEVSVALEQIKDLSFVKIRPADNRLFLHDEIYNILHQHVLVGVSPGETAYIYNTLQTHYAQLIEQARHQIDEVYHPQADSYPEIVPNPEEVRAKRSLLQDAIAEDFYYRLRWKPDQAFQQYFLYSEEAIANNDETLNALLRTELFSFLAECDPYGQCEAIEGLRWVDVIADSSVRWVVWLWSQDKFDEALALADRLTTDLRALIEPGGVLARAHLTIWRGYLSTFESEYETAETLLTTAIAKLNEWGETNRRTFRWAAILARGYNSLGYLYDRETRPYEAVDAYKKAISLWRAVKLPVEEATTLNNSAFARAKIGAFDTAFEEAKAGLNLREQLGPRVPVGYSVNTLALIELANNELTAARRDAERAAEIFRQIYSVRGRGLALIAFAEATRRLSHLIVYVQQGKSAGMLADAERYIQEAEEIFTTQVAEPNRKIEALREKARIYRTLARMSRERSHFVWNSQETGQPVLLAELMQKSVDAFQQAITLAQQQTNPFLPGDILLDRAFLDYYVYLYPGAPSFAEAHTQFEAEVAAAVEQVIPPEYRQISQAALPTHRSWYWVQTGILEILRGHIAFNARPVEQHDADSLYPVLEHYLLGLTVYNYFSDRIFQELRIAHDQLYENLRKLTSTQKTFVRQVVKSLEEYYGFAEGSSHLITFLNDRFGAIEEEVELSF